MCGRYTLSKKQLRFVRRLPYDELELFLKARFNVSPTQDVPIIRASNVAGGGSATGQEVPTCDGRRSAIVPTLVCENIRWGLQPAWAKSPIINAQCEGILKKPTFKDSVLERRCLIPADGFYEWRGKTPFHFTLPNDELFYFAGFVDDRAPARACCIITRAAEGVVTEFHKRMPVILRAEDHDRWLDGETTPAQLEEVFGRADGASLRAKAVAPLVPDGEPPKGGKSTQGELFL